MTDHDRRFAAGEQPYDRLNGVRIGALAGGLVGAIATVIAGLGAVWLVALGAIVGGATGYRFASRGEPRQGAGSKPGDD